MPRILAEVFPASRVGRSRKPQLCHPEHCLCAGLRVGEFVRLTAAAIDSSRW
jgi:hypothetical protein